MLLRVADYAVLVVHLVGISHSEKRPVLAKSELQSVEKVAISTFVRAIATKMCEIGLSRLRMGRNFLQYLSREASRVSRAQLHEIPVSTFPIQLGQ